MKVLLLLCSFLLASCATFHEKYGCKSPIEIKGKKYRFCRIRGEKEWGFYTFPENEEVLANKYKNIATFSKNTDKIVVQDDDDNFFLTDLSKKEFKNLNIKAFFNPPLYLDTSNNIEVALKHDHSLDIYDDLGNVVSNVKGLSPLSTKNEYGQIYRKVYRAWFQDVLIGRFIDQGKEYFQHFNTKGELLGKRYPLESVEIFLSHGNYLFFEKLDQDLYWPILYFSGGGGFLKRPKHIQGIGLLKNFEWLEHKSYHDLFNQNHKYPSFHYVLLVYQDKKGQKVLKNYVSKNTFKNWSDFKRVFADTSNKPPKGYRKSPVYTELKWFQRKSVNREGTIINVKTPYFKTKDNKYSYLSTYNNKSGQDLKDFETEAELIAYFEDKTKNIGQHVNFARNKKAQDAMRRMRIRQELAAEDRKNKEEMFRKKREAREYDRARIKAEGKAAWERVGQKLQNAAAQSKKKANCIKRQTQTKKDYLDKKQGWYETGGCK